jgi:hypothetical protein
MMHKLMNYSGNKLLKPEWQSVVLNDDDTSPTIHKIEYDFYSKYPIYVVENALSAKSCDFIIDDFDEQETHPVGIDGYCNPESNVGSYRANAWAEELSITISEKLRAFMDEKEFTFPLLGDGIDPIVNDKEFALPFWPHDMQPFRLLGSTPFMRFMKYKNGGMHTPHHDAPYKNEEERYISLFSWVLYLNTPDGTGGHFQFVNDLKQKGKHPRSWDTSDWTNMSNEVTMEVAPKQGKLLIFPHWLCHQVQEYIGEGYRYIIRGDVAYSF